MKKIIVGTFSLLLFNIFFVNNVNAESGSVNLYNLIKSKANKTTLINFNTRSTDDNNPTKGIFTTTNTEGGKEVYYYRGAVDDNNLIYNNMCWKIVRTTESNGTKLIYNGDVKKSFDYYKVLDKDKYNYVNDTSYPFTYSDGNWTSTNKDDDTEAVIEISGLSGDYAINYDLSTTESGDYFYVYVDDELIDYTSGVVTGQVVLENLNTNNVIKVSYYKDGDGYDIDVLDQIKFNVSNDLRNIKYTCYNRDEYSTIGDSGFNDYDDDNTFAGYMYGERDSSDYNETHENNIDSKAKTTIDNWFLNNFSTRAESKLEDAVYCNNRKTVSYDSSKIKDSNFSSYGDLGYFNNNTLYKSSFTASEISTNISPDLTCPNNNDKFTVSTFNGNGKLTYPVALLTADEAALAGYIGDTSGYLDDENYLCNETYTNLTMTPSYFRDGTMYMVTFGYHLVSDSVTTEGFIRPVLSLANNINVEDGNGKKNDPYQVSLYTIKFDTGLDVLVDNFNVLGDNLKAIKPIDPEKEGYTFLGWYKDKELTQEYDFASVVTKDMTLYAKWEGGTVIDNPNTSDNIIIWIILDVISIVGLSGLVIYKKKF